MGARARPVPFSLTFTAEQGSRFVPFLRRHLSAAHGLLRPAPRELSLALVSDRSMATLHDRFMGIPTPTDVLTFPLEEDAYGCVLSGEVILCVPEARRQAKRLGTTVEQELLLYALHGMLHLCGYDDRTNASFAAMHRTEDQILTKLGVGPVFAAAPPRRAAPPAAPRRRAAKPPAPRRRRATGAR